MQDNVKNVATVKESHNSRRKERKRIRGITLITLIITVIVLLILAGVALNFVIGENGILKHAKVAEEKTNKQTATEKMNLKITTAQMNKYVEEQRMPTLQEFADELCEDNEIQYVQLQSKKVASLSKIEVGNANSIFTKLKEYPYEFEINSSLQLASIDGNKTISNPEDWEKMNTWEKLFDIGFTLDEIANNELILSKATNNQKDIEYMISNSETIMPSIINSKIAMKYIGNNKNIYKRIFGDNNENINANATWISAILNSSNAISGIDETNPITVPIMTGYSKPTGEVTASTEYDSNYEAWKAFNGTISGNTDAWHSGTLPAWIQYKFDEPTLIYKFYMQNRTYSYPLYVNAVYEFSLQGSLNGEDWDILGEYTNPYYASASSNMYTVKSISKRYYYYRIYITSAKLSDGSIIRGGAAIGKLQVYF